MKNIKGLLPYAAAPLIVAAVILTNYYFNGLYPFGSGTIAWCDMTQQVIPLLADLKDMLSGDAGVFLNFQNAGAMNMWGVIFFFLASPFSLLVVFVEKTNLIYFVNILLILKLMTCSVTSLFYFRKLNKRLSLTLAVALSIAYAFCGYGMLYYQNIIWLDMMYLFPLLMASFNSLIEDKKILPYTAAVTAMMVVNYYISYMVVLFILLFMGVFCLRYRNDEKYKEAPVNFVIGSLLAAAASAVVWLPSFIQYLSSGRTGNFFAKLQTSGFFTSYQTTLPTILSSTSILIVTVLGAASGRRRSKKAGIYLVMLLLTLIPLYIEPINIMWHTGSYMSFPSRFGFITNFLLAACAGYFLADFDKTVTPKGCCNHFLTLILSAAAIYLFTLFSLNFVEKNRTDISQYTTGLWGNDTSLHLIIELCIIAAVVYAFYLALYRRGLISKQLLGLFMTAMVVVEGYANLSIYVTSPNVNDPERAVNQQQVMDLADRIDDESGFFRVNTTKKLFDVNLVGAMGYGSISHYTSLTNEDYMFAMKRLGYSSYWMEVGSYGGTELTDALLNIKYTIDKADPSSQSVYSNDSYTIEPSEYYLASGLVTDKSLTDCGDISDLTRGEIQQYLYENSIGGQDEKLIEFCQCDTPETAGQNEDGGYSFEYVDTSMNVYVYTVKVEGRKSLYFDCFDKPSNSLTEPINGSFTIAVNGTTVQTEYPSKGQNGLLSLGEFEDETVTVTVRLLKSCECASYGVFTLDLDMLEQAVSRSQTVNFTQDGGRLSGAYTAKAGESCLLTIAYSDDLNIKINGRSVEYSKTLGDFVSFELVEGENEITVTQTPKGFAAGAIISVIGILLCVIYVRLREEIKPDEIICKAFCAAIVAIGIIVFATVYVLPTLINIVINL